MSASLAGMLLGLAAAAGVLLVATFAPPFRSVRLVDRLAPYVHDTPPPSRLLGTATEAGLLTAVRPPRTRSTKRAPSATTGPNTRRTTVSSPASVAVPSSRDGGGVSCT